MKQQLCINYRAARNLKSIHSMSVAGIRKATKSLKFNTCGPEPKVCILVMFVASKCFKCRLMGLSEKQNVSQIVHSCCK